MQKAAGRRPRGTQPARGCEVAPSGAQRGWGAPRNGRRARRAGRAEDTARDSGRAPAPARPRTAGRPLSLPLGDPPFARLRTEPPRSRL